MHLGLVGHQLGERPRQPQSLSHELAAATVALVEDQVDDRQHGGQPIGQQVVRRNAERDSGSLDLPLCPHQPLGHGRLSDQECASDLSGAQAPERPQGEGDLLVGGERRMTAGENEFESLVWKCRRVHRVLRCLGHREQAGLGGQRAIAADAIDRAVARRRHQPGTGVGRSSVARPALRGDRKGLLRGFLGEIEVAEEADERSEDASPLLAEGLLQDRYHSMIGRTSIAPPMLAAGIRAASSIAASRSSASKKR